MMGTPLVGMGTPRSLGAMFAAGGPARVAAGSPQARSLSPRMQRVSPRGSIPAMHMDAEDPWSVRNFDPMRAQPYSPGRMSPSVSWAGVGSPSSSCVSGCACASHARMRACTCRDVRAGLWAYT
jgi:hypothetical protein